MSIRPFSAVILAAGRGNRMCTTQPKALQPLAGKALIQHLLESVIQLKPYRCYIVYGYNGDQLQSALKTSPFPLYWVQQTEQLGTGHAVQQVLPYVEGNERLLILYSDVPLVSVATLRSLLTAHPAGGICLLTAQLGQPSGYGRILRRGGTVFAIVEQQEADHIQQQIQEINSGILVADNVDLQRWLDKLNRHHSGEYYLTDIIALASSEQCVIRTVHPNHHLEIRGVNTPLQLAELERCYQKVFAN